MQNIAIFPVPNPGGPPSFRAVTKGGQYEGRTAGEALDAVAAELPSSSGAVVVIQPFLPDSHFTVAQQQRLQELMATWRAARDAGQRMPTAEQAELELLIEAELQAASDRTAQVLQGLGQ